MSPCCWVKKQKVAENNSSTAALQIMQAVRKHIFFFVVIVFFYERLRFTMWRRHDCQIPLISQEFSLTLKEVFASLFKLMHISIFIWADILLCNETLCGICVHTLGRYTSVRGAQGSDISPASHQHPSKWAAGCLEARGTTASCYTQCSVGEKVTFPHHLPLSNTDIHEPLWVTAFPACTVKMGFALMWNWLHQLWFISQCLPPSPAAYCSFIIKTHQKQIHQNYH